MSIRARDDGSLCDCQVFVFEHPRHDDIHLHPQDVGGGRVAFADPRIFDMLVMQFGSVKNAGYLYCLVREDQRHGLLDNNLCAANHYNTPACFLLRNASTESHRNIWEP